MTKISYRFVPVNTLSHLKVISECQKETNGRTHLQEKKEEIRLSPMTKAPTPTEMSKVQSDNTNDTKKFDYTAVADRLRTVSWSTVTTATQLMLLTWFTGQPSHSRNNRVIKRTHV